jgi:hypothetical protein
MIEKVCTKCKISKPLEEFYPSSYGKLGYTSQCKICQKEKLYAWRKEQRSIRQASLGNDGTGPSKPPTSENSSPSISNN